MRKITIGVIIEELTKIASTLEELDLAYEIREDETLRGLSFDNANEVLGQLEEKTHVLTHELSANIGFGLQEVAVIITYIKFRHKYQRWNNGQLQEIVDGPTTLHVLKEYLSRHTVDNYEDRKQLSQEIRKIRQEWNEEFGNQPYGHVIAKITQ
jgi:hypothetical protein